MKATNEALDAGIAATKPGNTADDVAQKFWGVLDKYYHSKTAESTGTISRAAKPCKSTIYSGSKTYYSHCQWEGRRR